MSLNLRVEREILALASLWILTILRIKFVSKMSQLLEFTQEETGVSGLSLCKENNGKRGQRKGTRTILVNTAGLGEMVAKLTGNEGL